MPIGCSLGIGCAVSGAAGKGVVAVGARRNELPSKSCAVGGLTGMMRCGAVGVAGALEAERAAGSVGVTVAGCGVMMVGTAGRGTVMVGRLA